MCALQVAGRSLVGLQFYALKRVLRGIDLAPEKIEVLPVEPGSNTYKLRIISRIAFQFYNYKWCVQGLQLLVGVKGVCHPSFQYKKATGTSSLCVIAGAIP